MSLASDRPMARGMRRFDAFMFNGTK